MDNSNLWKEYKRAQQPKRQGIIENISRIQGFLITKLTDYQFRIKHERSEKIIDIYPIHLRYHIIDTNERGQVFGEKKLINFVKSVFGN